MYTCTFDICVDILTIDRNIYHFMLSLHLSINVVCSCVAETNLQPSQVFLQDFVVKTEVPIIIILTVNMSVAT